MQVKDFAYVAVAALLFASLLVPLRACVVDDTYIHLQYARNLADRCELSFNRGEPSYGATSPLWVGLLALARKAGADIFIWCRVLSWLFAIAAVALTYRLAARFGGAWAPVAAAFIVASDAWFVRWSAVGMETSFASFAVLLALAAGLEAHRGAWRSALFGLLLFVAALARPEGLLLAALAPVAFLAGRARPARRFVFALVFVPLLAAWLYVIHRHTGSYFPLTAGAKQGAPAFSADLFRRALVPLSILGSTSPLPWLALAAGLVVALVRERSVGRAFGPDTSVRAVPGILLALLWIVALPVAYVVFDFQVLSRYLVPVVPPAVVLGCVAFERLAARFAPRPALRGAAIAVFAAAAILQSGAVYLSVVVPPTRAFSEALAKTVANMGKAIDHEAPAEAVVATPDIGAIGYYAHRRVLDLGGLVSPEIHALRETVDTDEIIDRGLYLRFGPTYLVDRSEIPDRFAGRVIDGRLFTPVRSGEVPNLGIRKPAPVVYTLYRISPAEGAAEGVGAGNGGGGS